MESITPEVALNLLRSTFASFLEELSKRHSEDAPKYFPNGIELISFEFSIGPKDSPLISVSTKVAGKADVAVNGDNP